jgi:hypothetical protein
MAAIDCHKGIGAGHPYTRPPNFETVPLDPAELQGE